eukprot:1153556-Pelagomonas_calceolata.AAC.3
MQALGASSRISARTLAPSRPSRACVKPMALFGTASPSSDIYSIKVGGDGPRVTAVILVSELQSYLKSVASPTSAQCPSKELLISTH